ncbi:MAG TPA: NAD(P)H-dependent glycerol-3-phosphate dehydrogenase [Polyangiaceae bacterium]|jgi:glycerol-3-phosphate dehydrogenase (NAD(P)+)|nr:NAD(P)H-dependent glycerol-3-phosphate dehydrogenase [Polyangiaceae bacterium]
MSHVAILGAGAWGTALARVLAEHGESPQLWTWQAEHAEAMQSARENREFLPGFALDSAIEPSADLGRVLHGANAVLLVVPTAGFRATLEQARPLVPTDATLIIATKGIEPGSLMLLSEVVEAVLGEASRERVVVLSGPSFAKEVALGLPTSVVAASVSEPRALSVQQRFSSDRFRVYAGDDPIGVQVGGALKNVIAIAAGACDGLGFGYNTRAALITRGLAEVARLALAKGGHALTLSGLAGLGDLVLTCTGELSRNRTVGYELGRGKGLAEALGELGHVAEGVITAESAYHLAARLGVDLPISSEVYRVLFEDKPVSEAVRAVLSRPLKRE